MSENAAPTTNITFATEHVNTAGKVFEAGQTYAVHPADARLYINIGRARLADEGAKAIPEDKAPTADEIAASDSKKGK